MCLGHSGDHNANIRAPCDSSRRGGRIDVFRLPDAGAASGHPRHSTPPPSRGSLSHLSGQYGTAIQQQMVEMCALCILPGGRVRACEAAVSMRRCLESSVMGHGDRRPGRPTIGILHWRASVLQVCDRHAYAMSKKDSSSTPSQS